ncbi:hypothetical protein K7432_016809 [Basidiobolus ranarum]|uniref:HIRAN domain-containing protein n=1 Tax=Basidiobolus ranarum TaxID=34480 RepID=A0ABR2WE70_9FUNG
MLAKKWKPHPNSKDYSYCTNLVLNGWHVLKNNDSNLVVGLVNHSESKILSPNDINFLINNNLDFDPKYVDGTIYKFIIQVLNNNSDNPTSYTSKWFTDYNTCLDNMTTFDPKSYWKSFQTLISQNIVDNSGQIINLRNSKLNSDKYTFIVVGMKYRGNHSFSVGDKITLLEENNNPHDPNAIQVLVDNNHVAYVSRENAPTLRSIGVKHKVCTCLEVFSYSAKFVLECETRPNTPP